MFGLGRDKTLESDHNGSLLLQSMGVQNIVPKQ